MIWYEFMVSVVLSFCRDEYLFVSVNKIWRSEYLRIFQYPKTAVSSLTRNRIVWASSLTDWKPKYAVLSAAMRGDIEILNNLKSSGLYDTHIFSNCPVNISIVMDTAETAISHNQLNVIEWLSARGILSWKEENTYYGSTLTQAESACGKAEILQYLLNKGYSVFKSSLELASLNGHLDIVKILLSHDKALAHRSIHLNAVRNNHLHIVEWLYENGFISEQGDPGIECDTAAYYGHLTILKWLKDHNFAWSADTGLISALMKEYELMKWALMNGCPVHTKIIEYLIGDFRLEEVKWYIDHGFPWERKICIETAKKRSREIYDCLISIDTSYKFIHLK